MIFVLISVKFVLVGINPFNMCLIFVLVLMLSVLEGLKSNTRHITVLIPT